MPMLAQGPLDPRAPGKEAAGAVCVFGLHTQGGVGQKNKTDGGDVGPCAEPPEFGIIAASSSCGGRMPGPESDIRGKNELSPGPVAACASARTSYPQRGRALCGRRKTMKGNTKGRRAARSAKYWRTVYVGPRDARTPVLKSPDGAEYRGTRAEVSAAALLPLERRMLAEGLRILHMVGFQDPNERRELCMARRRDAIEEHGHGRLILGSDAATEVMTEAAARYAGIKVAELKRRAILSEIEALLDEAGEFPLTRRERLALEATGKRQSDFNCLLKLKELQASRS